jgi:hypothetical protein
MSHYEGHFEGAKTFLTPSIVPSAARDNLGVKKVIVPKKKNYVPKFLKQRDIGNFMSFCNHGPSILSLYSFFSSFILIIICRENPAKYPSLAKIHQSIPQLI